MTDAVGPNVVGNPMIVPVGGPAPEGQIVRDMLKKAAIGAPVLVVVFGLIWGVPGALSTLYGIALVCLNFALAAALTTWSARISVAMLGAAAMFGFLIRLGIIFAAVLLVREAWWVSLVPLGITIIVTHLGLLFWEMKFVSASLAFPGLKPKTQEYTAP
jgi:hypothetical protein